MFNGGPGPRRGGNQKTEKSKNFVGASKRLVKELGSFRWLVAVAILLAVGGSVLSVIAPDRLADLADEISKGLIPHHSIDMSAIQGLAILLILFYATSALCEFFEGIIMADVSNNFAKVLRTRISNKINRLPLSYFDKNQTGDILSRITNDVDTVAQNLNQSLSTVISESALLIGAAVMMFVTNFTMAVTAIVASLIGFAFMAAILKRSQKYFLARQTELGKLNSHIEETYSGLLVIKAYNGKAESDKKFDKYNHGVYEASLKSQFLSSLMLPIMDFVGNLGYVAVCVVGALLVSNGAITFGVIVAFIAYVRIFTFPLSRIAQAFTSLQSAAAASERVFEFIDEPEMSDQKEITEKVDLAKIKGDIKFEHVKFGYSPDRLIIKDFSAEAKAGQKIAIVGPTGAGKTTMVNLLMKFYDINDGDIKIDGVSIRRLTREDVHALFTMVLQDTWMFSGTVRENIVYNRKDVDDQQILKVCDMVGISHFVKTLENGLDTEVAETDAISAGEKQLITIARGMIKNAPFLILDEATSNVDTRTEELAQKAMDKLMEGRTSFVIAHRLSTIKNADLILVMNEGNIIETGTHDQLMKQRGFYSELYDSQFAL